MNIILKWLGGEKLLEQAKSAAKEELLAEQEQLRKDLEGEIAASDAEDEKTLLTLQKIILDIKSLNSALVEHSSRIEDTRGRFEEFPTDNLMNLKDHLDKKMKAYDSEIKDNILGRIPFDIVDDLIRTGVRLEQESAIAKKSISDLEGHINGITQHIEDIENQFPDVEALEAKIQATLEAKIQATKKQLRDYDERTAADVFGAINYELEIIRSSIESIRARLRDVEEKSN